MSQAVEKSIVRRDAKATKARLLEAGLVNLEPKAMAVRGHTS